MGIRFYCPNGHKLNVKEFQAGRRGICPFCGARTQIPQQSTRQSGKGRRRAAGQGATQTLEHDDAQDSDSSPDILPGEPPGLPGDPVNGKMLGPSMAPSRGEPGPIAAPPAAKTAQEAAIGARSAGFELKAESPSVRASQSSPAKAGTTAAAPISAHAPLTPSAAPGGNMASTPPPAAQSETPDAIAEAADMIWYIRPPTGGQFGPAPGDLMRTWLNEGRVSADSLVWREGWRDWQEAGTIFPKLRGNQFIDVLEGTPAAPAAVAPAAHVHRPKAHHAADRSQMTLLAILFLAVVVLIFIFLYVLFK